MPTQTTNYSLWIYNNTTDAAEVFADFRADVAGTGAGTNMIVIDATMKSLQDQITALGSSLIDVPATFVSGSAYAATVAEITGSYVDKTYIALSVDTTVPASPTVNISTIGASSLKKVNAAGTLVALDAKDLVLNRLYLFRYSTASSCWIWISSTDAASINIAGTSGNFVKIDANGNIADSTSKASDFAVAAKGVTNGDTHDHSGGDGAQISHAGLSSIQGGGVGEYNHVTNAQVTVINNTSGTNSGNETTTTIGTLVNGATEKTTPIDADMVGLMDSAAGNIIKKLSWLNIKATAKAYFDTIYAALVHTHATADIISGTMNTARLGSGTPNSENFLRGDSTWASPALQLKTVTILTAGTSGTFVTGAGVSLIDVEVVGGGGGGGGLDGVTSQMAVTGGGAGGSYARKRISFPAATYAYAVGAGGAGGTGGAVPTSGSTGGASNFGTISAAGGTGGFSDSGGTGNAIISGGSPGAIGTTGDINATGNSGENGLRLSATIGSCGGSGSSYFGGGRFGFVYAGGGGYSGLTGGAYGAGGTGVLSANSTDRAGADGAGGIIIVREYAPF